jgi:gamma-glutamyltranspeptidase/glutathione hydrolase
MNGADETIEAAGTSHISIVDAEGNAVAMTTTIESGFGSGLWAEGFLLNNEMTDFSFRPTDRDRRPIANAVAPGKRPRSSMAPTLILDASGNLAAVLGSPGGSRIIWYVLKTVVALSDWRLDAQAAAALPNFGARGRLFELEEPSASVLWAMPAGWRRLPQQAIGLHALGHDIVLRGMTSGTHVIVRRPDGMLEGGADPRRDGMALGD